MAIVHAGDELFAYWNWLFPGNIQGGPNPGMGERISSLELEEFLQESDERRRGLGLELGWRAESSRYLTSWSYCGATACLGRRP